ncbi:uncharacterized protein TNIN_23161 [Trichonephila inaurata madagascariensis]|uniref:Helitron helicase-like domain-containing protein n=1 Tax=Trichonephila inaurata madagascariensis TaxID=2747483 RepID=A0A8X7CGF8_9ARAC|nr:uncharacterized protein TNIN_23161 [Trichonephila inaurata madagascariensis]
MSQGICCSSGKVLLDSFQQPPEPLSLLCGKHDQSQYFLNNIRRYNSAFQMTFGAKTVLEGNYMPTFKIQGQLYHLIGSLLPVDNARESFLQIYFVSDYMLQRDARLRCFPNLNPMLVECLQSMLIEIKSYIRDFKTALQSFPPNSNENDYKIVINADGRPSAEYREGDNHWCYTLTDASISSSVSKLRQLFAMILVFCNVSNPSELWDTFKDHFMEDYVGDFQRHYPNADINAHLEN